MSATESRPRRPAPDDHDDAQCDVYSARSGERCQGTIAAPFRAVCEHGHVMEGMACRGCHRGWSMRGAAAGRGDLDALTLYWLPAPFPGSRPHSRGVSVFGRMDKVLVIGHVAGAA